MKSRVEGRSPKSLRYPHLWLGKPICGREEFLRWALNDPQYQYLHRNWAQNDYPRRLAPSIDRINPYGGYTLNNIQFVTQSLNSKKGAMVREDRHKSKAKQAVERLVKKYAA